MNAEDVIRKAAEYAFEQGKGVHGDISMEGVDSVPVLKVATEDVRSYAKVAKERYPEEIGVMASRYAMLEDFDVYVETPFYRMNENRKVQQYTKEIVTKNPSKIAEWMGITVEESIDTYKTYLPYHYEDFESAETRVLRYNLGTDLDRKITKPRKMFNVSRPGMRMIPLVALEHYVSCLQDRMKNEIVRVTFQKDNGDERVIDTTYNRQILEDIYGKVDFVDRALDESFQGQFYDNPTLLRGYIRVPEVGASIYDSPTRSINYGRITKVEFGVEPDTTFINIDITSAPLDFINAVEVMHVRGKSLDELVSDMQSFGMGVQSLQAEGTVYPSMLSDWVMNGVKFLGTNFSRYLVMFMLVYANHFPNYTGMRLETRTQDFGLE